MFRLLQRFNKNNFQLSTKWRQGILFILILSLGIFARTWEYNRLPPGLNADEASIGVDAFSLYHFGIDRNGNSYPIVFISWGSGQNALYGYLLIPFIALFGLTPAVVRTPMLISGILSILLVFLVARKTINTSFGFLSMFFLAISPWHIVLSRWGLESNIFPFIFLIGYSCLLYIEKDRKWFIAACFFFALSLYAYGTAYAMVPVFMVCMTIILFRTKTLRISELIPGVLIFIFEAIPIGLFVLINALGVNSINFGPFTIPHLPVSARFKTEAVIFNGNLIPGLLGNLWTMLKLLVLQSDDYIVNTVEPYGYFYKITFPLALIGLILLVKSNKSGDSTKIMLLLSWLGASFLIGIIQQTNVNRLNIIFIPIILSIAYCLFWLKNYHKFILPTSICLLLIGFIFFTIFYHGEAFRQQVDVKYNSGLFAALKFTKQFENNPICMTNEINMPYIFALFSEQDDPGNYLNSVKYIDPNVPLRQVVSFGRYTFGTKNCTGSRSFIYILRTDEIPPPLGHRYNFQFFDNFVVFLPKGLI
jgi:hypothetical protein